MTDSDHPAVARVKQMWEQGEFDKLDEMLSLWDSYKALGRAGDFLRRVVIWLGVIVGAWFVTGEYLVKLLRPGEH